MLSKRNKIILLILKIFITMYYQIIKVKKIRNGIFAYQYGNGLIWIDGQKYLGYSLTGAINCYRSKNKKK